MIKICLSIFFLNNFVNIWSIRHVLMCLDFLCGLLCGKVNKNLATLTSGQYTLTDLREDPRNHCVQLLLVKVLRGPICLNIDENIYENMDQFHHVNRKYSLKTNTKAACSLTFSLHWNLWIIMLVHNALVRDSYPSLSMGQDCIRFS